MMTYGMRLGLFLLLNFAALGIGGLFTGKGVSSVCYAELKKAPWTPPGYVFGLAWTAIMICLSFFMAGLKDVIADNIAKTILALYALQWALNVIWNPLFFKYHLSAIALVAIILLFIVVAAMLYYASNYSNTYALLIVPYTVWLLIAISLNVYIVLKNS